EAGEMPESPDNERLMQRLAKAGFVEVAPTVNDKQFFAYVERFRHMSPADIVREWQENQREIKERMGIAEDGEAAGEKFATFIASVLDVLVAIASPAVEKEAKSEQSPSKPA